MRRYKFVISVIPSVMEGGVIFEDDLFTTDFWVDREVDAGPFAEKLFSLWKEGRLLGDSQDKWTFEYLLETV